MSQKVTFASGFKVNLGQASVLNHEVLNEKRKIVVDLKGFYGLPVFIELDYGKIYRKALYLMVKTMVSYI